MNKSDRCEEADGAAETGEEGGKTGDFLDDPDVPLGAPDPEELWEEYHQQAAQIEAQREELVRIQQTMETGRARFVRLFHQAPVGYVTLDSSGIIRDGNRTFAGMVGLEVDDLLGSPFPAYLEMPEGEVFISRFRAFFKKPGEKRIETRIRRNGGSGFPARLEAITDTEAGGGSGEEELAPRLLITISDISEQKAAQERTEQVNALLRAIRNVNHLIAREKDPEILLERACAELKETRGYERAWVALLPGDGSGCPRVFDSEGREGREAECRKVEAELPACFQRALEHPQGIWSPSSREACEGCPLASGRGDLWSTVVRMSFAEEVFGALGVYGPVAPAGVEEEKDLLMELAADLALALSVIREREARRVVEERLATANLVVEQSPGILFRWGKEDQWPVEYVSENIRRFGYRQEDFLSGGTHYADLIHPKDLGRVGEEVKLLTASGKDEFYQEYRIVTAGGETRWVHDRTTVIRDEEGEILRFQGIVLDITEQKLAILALDEERRRLLTTLDSIGDAVIVTDPEGKIRAMNPVAQRLTGWRLHEARGNRLSQVFSIRNSRTGEPVENPVQRALREGTVVALANHTALKSRDGMEFQIADTAAPIRGSDGKILGVVLVFRDVTEEYRLQEELRFQATCLAQTQDLVTATDLDGIIRYVNDAVCQLFGRPEEAFLGKPLDLLGEDDREGATQEEILKAGRTHGTWRGRVANVLPDGRKVLMDCRVRSLLDEEGEPMGLVGISSDITDQVRAEEERVHLQQQLQQAMKMEAVGRLAGGLAHDFNNHLTTILGNLEIAMEEMAGSHPAYELLEEVHHAGESAAGLTRQLLAFSRKQIIEPRTLDVNALLESLHRMLVRLIGEHIELETRFGEDLSFIRVDPGVFEQMIVNLAVNARDAMPGGGRLLLTTREVPHQEVACQDSEVSTPGDYVALDVTDTGHGMVPEVQEHIFEPFYTTKPQGEGTGLGLATIYGAVRQVGGCIGFETEPGKGTSFTLYFPAVTEDATELEEARSIEDVSLGKGETVLLVEDEDAVRGLACRVLENAGYRILEAADGHQALRLLEGNGEPIQLLLTDVVMPGINGRELADRLREIQPDLRVIFTSGYTGDLIRHHGVLEEEIDFLPKPYTPAVLAQRVRRALDQPSGSG